MSIKWKYKIEIKDKEIFNEIENERNIIIPSGVINFLCEVNAATPSLDTVMIGNDEKVLGAILTFNRDDKDVDSVFTALTIIENNDLLPFAIDPSGNYFCYSVNKKCVVYYNHEEDEYIYTSYDFEQFIKELH